MVFNGEGRNVGNKVSTAYASLDSDGNRASSHGHLTTGHNIVGRKRSLKSSVV